eukprot:98180-Chlamydomonas_euryale.AAC.1
MRWCAGRRRRRQRHGCRHEHRRRHGDSVRRGVGAGDDAAVRCAVSAAQPRADDCARPPGLLWRARPGRRTVQCAADGERQLRLPRRRGSGRL